MNNLFLTNIKHTIKVLKNHKYLLYRPKYWYHDAKSWIKGKIFQAKHGFDYRDTWNLDYKISEYILPRLKYFRDNLHSVPPRKDKKAKMTDSGPTCLSIKEWQAMIDKMSFAFQYVVDGRELNDKYWNKDYVFDQKTAKDDYKKYEEGMKLFSIWFSHLWD